ncbi:hypothetical protein EJB05_29976, partial [Eragrostis curvula]
MEPSRHRGTVYAVRRTAVAVACNDLPSGFTGLIEELDPLLLVLPFRDVEAVAAGEDDVFVSMGMPPPTPLPLLCSPCFSMRIWSFPVSSPRTATGN